MIKYLFILMFPFSIIHWAICQPAVAHKPVELSISEIHYIYNRAFDHIIKDEKIGIDINIILNDTVFNNFESIYISIDPDLQETAFNTKYIPFIANKIFDDTLKIQDKFAKINIINFGNIEFRHYSINPQLHGSHIIHAIFSDIYTENNFLYFGVNIQYQLLTNQGVYTDLEWIIFEIELCESRLIMFRRYFVPVGVGLKGDETYYSHKIYDKSCF